MSSSAILLGINGNVFAIDRTTGEDLWCSELNGTDFVNLVLDGNLLIATSHGEAYGLDAATGSILWHNKLPGQGYGLVSIATAEGAANSAAISEKRRRDEQAAAAAHTPIPTGS